MVQTESRLNGPSIDAMLRGLTERPNVQSTLILSRRDGSIIAATGVAASKMPTASTPATGISYTKYTQTQQAAPTPVEGGSDVTQGAAEATETAQEKPPQPVELLASSIFQFVTNADALGVTLGTVSRGTTGSEGPHGGSGHSDDTTGSKQDAGNEEESDQTRGEDDVQLLRLRIKHQEIIIFPDPNYICCVIQRTGKIGAVTHR
ncbi:hypothetical protein A1O3_03465 [Capronia epimyces CBS 606.96]|uniref:Roadblock/LAMTOR2 domain-containing protein n=1 Tax=Capronia epimyces CBS 606.96 TaxID=1182542 RepID=W9YW55_9EURO|nr:uncharacterized protein A1O3_03465 [Capronia epimyces CBS 606.96]EXJ86514.1 hypothetical protein A1O3_03465 [Capronia epimyces CBS 606.96]